MHSLYTKTQKDPTKDRQYLQRMEKSKSLKPNGSMKNPQGQKEAWSVLLGQISSHISKVTSLPQDRCTCKSLLTVICRLLYLQDSYGKITHLTALICIYINSRQTIAIYLHFSKKTHWQSRMLTSHIEAFLFLRHAAKYQLEQYKLL